MHIGPHIHAGQFVDPALLDLSRDVDNNLVEKCFEQEVFVIPVFTVLPIHSNSRGSPTLTEISLAVDIIAYTAHRSVRYAARNCSSPVDPYMRVFG